MRVALELQPCCGKRSGIGMFTYELAKRLHTDGELEFCGNLFNFLGRNDNCEALNGIEMPINESRLFPYGAYRRLWDYIPLSYEMLFPNKADLTIFFNYIVPPKVKGKVMTTVHDMTYLRFPETMYQKNLKRIQEGIRYSVDRSNRVITLSEFSKKEICELLNVPEEKVSVIGCAPTFSGKCADWQETAAKFQIEEPYILYVGTIEPRKNLTRLLRSFELLKQTYDCPHKLVLAGGRGWCCEEIYQTATQITAHDDVIFTGYISQAEKNVLLKHAAVFVFPSLYEGFGIPPLEAMEMNCPVVCSNAASLPEVVGDAAELIEPLELEDMVRGIWRVLSQEEYRAELIQKGGVRKEKFTWERSALDLTELCKAVLGEK